MNLFSCIFILFVICLIQRSESRGESAKKCEKVLNQKDDKVNEFLNFVKRYQRNYKTEKECVTRFHAFRDNVKKAKEFQKTETGTAVYGASIFSDLTKEEFKNRFSSTSAPPKKTVKVKKRKIPSEFDWRGEPGVVNPVVDQLMGHHTCFAFASIANVESLYAIKHDKLYRLSQQQILDCYNRTERCSADKLQAALLYLKDKGAMTESDYPYTGNYSDCKYDPAKVVVKPDDVVKIPEDEKEIAMYLYEHGPVTASLNKTYLIGYVGGIIDQEDCEPIPDHPVVLVGYGISKEDNNKPFWYVRNNWGVSWGENGYFRIVRGKGHCGINKSVLTAVFN